MICVYPANCTDFSTNGNGTLAPLSAEVTETLNGEYELTLAHPIDEAGKCQRWWRVAQTLRVDVTAYDKKLYLTVIRKLPGSMWPA